MKLKPYPKYKDSGIQWIGKIPEGWEVHKTKFVLVPEIGKKVPEGKENYIELGDIDKKTKKYHKTNKLTVTGAKSVPKNTILISTVRPNLGGITITEEKINVSSAFCCLKMNSKFDFYYLNNDLFFSFLFTKSTGSTYPTCKDEDILNYPFLLPPEQDQTAIANFLDKKTAKIDALIEKDKKLIALLKEKRTALINQVVTKGLDPNVKLKDSGIEWIGKIPEGWEVNKIKNTSYVKGRIGWHGLTSEEYSDEGAYLVTGTDFKNGFVEWENCYHVGWDRYKEDPYIHLKENDLLITKDGTIGKVALVKNLPDKATLNSGIFLVRPLNKSYITKFMFWMLNSAVFERFFDYIKTGATISHLYQETFERFFFPVPSLQEQTAIANFLDKATSKIDKTIKLIEKKITLLEEYKKSLIYYVVTGKVDVREVVI